MKQTGQNLGSEQSIYEKAVVLLLCSSKKWTSVVQYKVTSLIICIYVHYWGYSTYCIAMWLPYKPSKMKETIEPTASKDRKDYRLPWYLKNVGEFEAVGKLFLLSSRAEQALPAIYVRPHEHTMSTHEFIDFTRICFGIWLSGISLTTCKDKQHSLSIIAFSTGPFRMTAVRGVYSPCCRGCRERFIYQILLRQKITEDN